MVLYVLLMWCSMKNVCHNFSTFFQAVLATIKMLLSILMNAFALLSLIASIVLVNGCYAVHKSINDPQWKEAFPSGIHKIFDACIYPNADGKVSSFIGDTSRFTNVSDMTKSLSKDFAQYNTPVGVTGSFSLDAYLNSYFIPQVENYGASNLFATTSGENPQDFINTQNDSTAADAIQCNNDKFALSSPKCPSSHTEIAHTAGSPGLEKAVSGNSCIVVSTWGHVFSSGSTGRYSNAPGNCAGARAAALEGIRLCTTDLKAKIAAFKAKIVPTASDGPGKAGKDYYDSIASIQAAYGRLNTAISDAAAVISSTTNGIDSFFNCKVIRAEFRNTFGNLCVKFAKNFAHQAIVLAIASVFFFVLSLCVCCSFRQAKAINQLKDLEKSQGHSAPAYQNNQMQFNYNTPRRDDYNEGPRNGFAGN